MPDCPTGTIAVRESEGAARSRAQGPKAQPIARLRSLRAQPIAGRKAPRAQAMTQLRNPKAQPMAGLRDPRAQSVAELTCPRVQPTAGLRGPRPRLMTEVRVRGAAHGRAQGSGRVVGLLARTQFALSSVDPIASPQAGEGRRWSHGTLRRAK